MKIKLFLKKVLPKKTVTKYRISKMLGYSVNIGTPKTFNEKIQWLKLYYKKKIITSLADKVAVRAYVSKTIGANYLIPIHGIYNHYSEIDFKALPETFALKAAHGSKWNIICQSKKELNETQLYKNIKKWAKSNYYWYGYEYAYKNIPPRFICEQLILDQNNQIPKDYKIFCFDGIPQFIQVDSDRFVKHTRAIYDTKWTRQPFELGFESSKSDDTPPQNLHKMLSIAESLSKDFPFVRVDLYDCDKQIYFGEMTFYPGEGSEQFKPQKWDRILGDFLNLPIN